MPSLFQNRYVKFAGFGLGTIFVLVLLLGVLSLLGSSTGLSDSSSGLNAPMVSKSSPSRGMMMESADMAEDGGMYYSPEPTPGNYTDGLESYETTSYQVSGRTKQFDEVCQMIANLKADVSIHFQSINTQTNYCRANFYVEKEQADAVVRALGVYGGIEISRDTSSVTRHRQQLQGRTDILQQQLVRVEKTLASAEAQLDRLNSRFYSTDEVSELSSEVTRSLQFIDQMTQKKINLISQLDDVYQQSADLEARMDVAEFSVNISRSNPIYPNKYEQRWEQAWEDLNDRFTETMIGLTATLGAFLLMAIQGMVYLAIIMVLAGLLWKFGRLVWRKI